MSARVAASALLRRAPTGRRPASSLASASASSSAAASSRPLPPDAYSPASPSSSTQLLLSHLTLAIPPTAALAALNARLALALPLPLVEQALIHPSFWALPPPSATDAPLTHYHDALRDSNAPLATLGNALLGTLTSELLLAKFPNLPTRVTKAALTLYVGPKSLSALAATWGVAPGRLEGQLLREAAETPERKLKRSDRAYGHLVGGVGGARKKANSALEGAAGGGLLRWNRTPTTPKEEAVLYEDALASVARAIVGAVFRTHGFAKTRTFVHCHFLPRLLSPTPHPSPASVTDLTPLLKFTSPTAVLRSTLASHSLSPPVHRLLHESGRLSAHPTFICGVFTADRKIGEGFGTSIRMSEWRASEDALRRYYLAGASGAKTEPKGGLPSDAWCSHEGAFEGMPIGETEVYEESAAR